LSRTIAFFSLQKSFIIIYIKQIKGKIMEEVKKVAIFVILSFLTIGVISSTFAG